jgi:hypothetical protein
LLSFKSKLSRLLLNLRLAALDHKDLQGLKERRVLRAQLDHKDHKAHRDHRASLVLPVLKARKDHKV